LSALSAFLVAWFQILKKYKIIFAPITRSVTKERNGRLLKFFYLLGTTASTYGNNKHVNTDFLLLFNFEICTAIFAIILLTIAT